MLTNLSVKEFAQKVAAHEPVVPAGGSVMALSGLMGVCLVEMSVDSAFGSQEGEGQEAALQAIKTQLSQLHEDLLTYIEKDAVAYGGVLAAYKLPKSTPTEIEQRQAKIQAAALAAIEIPLKITEACIAALESGIMLLPKVRRGVLGDLKIGLMAGKVGVEGALAAARINLSLIKEERLVREYQARIDKLQTEFDSVI